MVRYSSQHTSELRHSNEDVTVENARVLTDDISKTDLEVQIPVDDTSGKYSDYDHPDGGLTAWLVVVGVRLLLSTATRQFYDFLSFFFLQAMCSTCST